MENILARGLFAIKVETSYKCPECGSTDSFDIEVEVTGVYTIDGEGDVMDEHMDNEGEWGSHSRITCENCHHEGRVKQFRNDRVVYSGLPMVIDNG